MKHFASNFYHYRIAIKSTLFFCVSFISLAHCSVSGLPSELEEKKPFNVHKILNDACENQVAPKAFTDYTLLEDKNKIIQEAGEKWSELADTIENLKDESLEEKFYFLQDYLLCLALANNHFLTQQQNEFEKNQTLNSNQLSPESQKTGVPTLDTIVDIDEENLDQNHPTFTKDNMKIQRFPFWKRFYFFFSQPLFSIFNTKYTNFKK